MTISDRNSYEVHAELLQRIGQLEVQVRQLLAAHLAHMSARWCPICDPDQAG